MPGIYVTAVLTILVTALLGVAALGHLTRSDRRYYGLILVGLPLSLIVNRFIKIPIIASFAAWTGTPLKLGPEVPFWFIVMIWLNAPLFEEAIKVLPMVLPGSRAFFRDASAALWAGFALGIGVGLGEAAYLAYGIAQNPAYNGLPWHMFTGFAWERLIVTFAHGLMTSMVSVGFHDKKRKVFSGYLTAVGFHALINLGPILLALRLIPETVSSLASYIAILGAFVVFQKNERAARHSGSVTPKEILYFER